MSDVPEIPHAVSTEALHSLLERASSGPPVSAVIPALNLGGALGAPCDLQFVISQLIQRSSTGTNLVQMLVAATHLLSESEGHFSEQLARLDSPEPPYDRLSPAERAATAQLAGQHRDQLRAALECLEALLQEFSLPFHQARSRSLLSGPLAGRSIPVREFRSHLLISEELLDSLELERAAVTAFLDACAHDHPDPPTS